MYLCSISTLARISFLLMFGERMEASLDMRVCVMTPHLESWDLHR